MNHVQMVASGRKVVDALRSLVSVSNLQLKCAWVLQEALLIPVLLYGSEIMVCREKGRFSGCFV